VIFRLAEHSGAVLMRGGGFGGPEWSVRVSLANFAGRHVWQDSPTPMHDNRTMSRRMEIGDEEEALSI
jgi:hypothetical protein